MHICWPLAMLLTLQLRSTTLHFTGMIRLAVQAMDTDTTATVAG